MITIDNLTEFLGWAAIINIAILLLATLALVTMRKTVTGIHAKLFGLSETDLQKAYFQYLANYKIAITVFIIVPYISLKIIA
ncbi:hypothetical protein CWE08_11370 [Aliidiomarina iranensis]|uniref:DUF6868 domain-containing protein n=1 Tax=Aliidiomarina iranensis TaxID=1434071 RepID=A0A432VQM6_9GAMM|nr:hypothetical protein [Aliidiomarina iranensis]RUO18509.1 hypothetical protein CWE08_11370 [Aliidiomarina iranensis]